MSADLLRRAAALLRQRAETEQTLRDGDPYYAADHLPDGTEISEASAWERTVTPEVGRLVAHWLDAEARDLEEGTYDPSKPLTFVAKHIHHDFGPAHRTARALLGERAP